MKVLVYHLEGLAVPQVVRVPQVGNPCIKGQQYLFTIYNVTIANL